MGLLRAVRVVTLVALITVVLLEISSGYLLYRKEHRRDALPYALAISYEKITHQQTSSLRPWAYSAGGVRWENRDQNPFLEKGRIRTYQFHPLIDYTGAFSWEEINGRLDYFGFRNNEDYYFQSSEDPLVVLTGGSEAAGGHHNITIAQHLENALRNRTAKRWRVLNLAMHSYTLSNEMNAFLHLGYNLKPAIVITHSGWNDCLFGLMAPHPFQKLGLSYYLYQEGWLRRIYDRNATEVNSWRIVDIRNEPLLVKNYFQNIEKYRKLVGNSGARFIAGIQPYNKSHREHPAMNELYAIVHRQMNEIEKRGKTHGFITFPDSLNLQFVDSIHTDWPGAKTVGEIYADRILQNHTT